MLVKNDLSKKKNETHDEFVFCECSSLMILLQMIEMNLVYCILYFSHTRLMLLGIDHVMPSALNLSPDGTV
ncbi:hypothetical protein LNTAR_03279 [Lentisphaera araneosa HTCC2155]|uniref:Uncharacterized protein n=1 Tax=Lentisphaera araneosa HTCC2155 TaxID=313628 RepID=A6DT43_9BACT|nr:hypothetical protein LNTAR_03279 [Lentisphaera araneosa HTCC2155]